MKIKSTHDIIVRLGYGPNESNFVNANFPRQAVRHSEDYAWGYSGSGPNELAFNILLYFTEDKYYAEKYKKEFLELFIANADRTMVLTIGAMDIQRFLIRTIYQYDQAFHWDAVGGEGN